MGLIRFIGTGGRCARRAARRYASRYIAARSNAGVPSRISWGRCAKRWALIGDR